MPEEELFNFQLVRLTTPAELIISHQNAQSVCSKCGEEIINERQVVLDGVVMCKTCAFGGYYETLDR
jgi:formylmethanofuran dehydrogenase subunit E